MIRKVIIVFINFSSFVCLAIPDRKIAFICFFLLLFLSFLLTKPSVVQSYKKNKNYLFSTLFIVCFIIFWTPNFYQNFRLTSFLINGNAMEPSVKNGDLVILGEPKILERGDIVVYGVNDSTNYVGRILGMPLDNILFKNETIYINDNLVIEEYLDTLFKYSLNENYTVPLKNYFVLFDKRDNSYDSRTLGFIASESIKSKLVKIYTYGQFERNDWIIYITATLILLVLIVIKIPFYYKTSKNKTLHFLFLFDLTYVFFVLIPTIVLSNFINVEDGEIWHWPLTYYHSLISMIDFLFLKTPIGIIASLSLIIYISKIYFSSKNPQDDEWIMKEYLKAEELRHQAEIDRQKAKYEREEAEKLKKKANEEWKRTKMKHETEEQKMNDPYTVLGCHPNDSIERITEIYRKLMLMYHPDKYASSDEMSKKQKNDLTAQIILAYQWILKHHKRY